MRVCDAFAGDKKLQDTGHQWHYTPPIRAPPVSPKHTSTHATQPPTSSVVLSPPFKSTGLLDALAIITDPEERWRCMEFRRAMLLQTVGMCSL